MDIERKQERNSCIEALRILSMLAIIATHYVEINYLDYLDVSVITFNREFRWKRIVKLSGTVWFYSIVLDAIFPFLNKGLKALNMKEHFRLILLLLFMASVIPTFTTQQYFYSNFLWFIVLYCVAAYIRLYAGEHSYSYRLLLAGGAEFLFYDHEYDPDGSVRSQHFQLCGAAAA